MMAKSQNKGGSPATAAKIQRICENRRVTHNYAIEDRLEAGIVLTGTEVKACRAGKAHLNDAYVQVIRNEAMLVNAHIAEYSHGNRLNHEPLRLRKLLMHRREIDKLEVRLRERGYSAVPMALYFKGGRVKVEIGIGKGKTSIDRRVDIKEREARREIDRTMRRSQR